MLQELICSSADVLPPATSPNVVVAAAARSSPTNNGQCNDPKEDDYRLTTEALLALHPTVVALHLFAKYEQKSKNQPTPPSNATNYTAATTNTKPHDDHTDEYNILSDSHLSGANVRPSSLSVSGSHNTRSSNPSHSSDVVRTRRRDHSQMINNGVSNSSPDSDYNAIRRALQTTSSKTKKRKIASAAKKTFGNGTDGQLIGIAEECEYDSDVGKFNCADEDDDNVDNGQEPFVSQSNEVDDIQIQPPRNEIALQNTRCLHLASSSNNNKEPFANCTELHNLSESNSRNKSTWLCAGGFMLTIVLLFLFPLPD